MLGEITINASPEISHHSIKPRPNQALSLQRKPTLVAAIESKVVKTKQQAEIRRNTIIYQPKPLEKSQVEKFLKGDDDELAERSSDDDAFNMRNINRRKRKRKGKRPKPAASKDPKLEKPSPLKAEMTEMEVRAQRKAYRKMQKSASRAGDSVGSSIHIMTLKEQRDQWKKKMWHRESAELLHQESEELRHSQSSLPSIKQGLIVTHEKIKNHVLTGTMADESASKMSIALKEAISKKIA